MRKFIQILTTLMLLTACTKEGDIIYQPDPADQASRAPLVTVIYDPNAVGDGGYTNYGAKVRIISDINKKSVERPLTPTPISRVHGRHYK